MRRGILECMRKCHLLQLSSIPSKNLAVPNMSSKTTEETFGVYIFRKIKLEAEPVVISVGFVIVFLKPSLHKDYRSKIFLVSKCMVIMIFWVFVFYLGCFRLRQLGNCLLYTEHFLIILCLRCLLFEEVGVTRKSSCIHRENIQPPCRKTSGEDLIPGPSCC